LVGSPAVGQELKKAAPAKKAAAAAKVVEANEKPKDDPKAAAEAPKEPAPAEEELDPNIAQFIQQYQQQFQQVVKGELLFIRTICRPTKEQHQRIAATGDQAVKETVKAFADVQKKMMRGMVAGQQSTYPDPRKLIGDALAKSVKATLSAEQAARYQDELDKRAANRKRVAVSNLVARLDHDLVLTAEQRDKLATALAAQWNDAWGQLELFQYGDQFTPNIPDNLVLPLLTETQKGVWRGGNRNQNVFWGWAGLGFMHGVQFDDAWEAPAEPEPAKPDEKPEEPK
jgi:hypothetical protein